MTASYATNVAGVVRVINAMLSLLLKPRTPGSSTSTSDLGSLHHGGILILAAALTISVTRA